MYKLEIVQGCVPALVRVPGYPLACFWGQSRFASSIAHVFTANLSLTPPSLLASLAGLLLFLLELAH